MSRKQNMIIPLKVSHKDLTRKCPSNRMRFWYLGEMLSIIFTSYCPVNVIMVLFYIYYSKFDRDHFLFIKKCIVNVQIHGRVCNSYIAYCLEQQLVCIAVLTKVHTAHTLQMNPCTLKILRNTAFQLAHQNCQFSLSNREKDLI